MPKSFQVILALAFILPPASPGISQEKTYSTEIHTTGDGVRYMSSGVGYDSRVNLPRFPLRLIFAAKTGAYLAEIDVEISPGPTGKPTTMHSPGPWLDVDLPAGNYRIKAHTGSGLESVKSVTVVKGSTTQVKLVWNVSDEDI